MLSPLHRASELRPRTRALEILTDQLTIQHFRVEVVAGPDRGLVATSQRGGLTVGSSAASQLRLTDPTVARHHCALDATVDGFLLRDLDSPTGTVLAGFRVAAAYLEHGALVQLGDTQLRFEPIAAVEHEPLATGESFEDVVAGSAAMRRIFARLDAVAGGEATILIEGEIGTGKGQLARAVHQRSARAEGPFIVVECARAAATVERELLGDERGPGALERAAGGTLFLAEVGELSPELQSRLARVLGARLIRRGASTHLLDVRVVASNRADLRRAVNRGELSPELFDRLAALRVEVPALRDRRDDITRLGRHFYRQLTGLLDGEPPAELMSQLGRQSLPGNVREVRTAIERALADDARAAVAASVPALADDAVAAAALPDDFDFSVSFRDAKERAVARFTAAYVRELLAKFDGNLSRAARTVAMDRNHLRDLLRKYVAEPA